MLEYARSVLGMADAGHEEYGATGTPLITQVACALPGNAGPALFGSQPIRLEPGTRIAAACGGTSLSEPFQCSYQLNPAFQAALAETGLRIAGWSAEGEARAIELPDRRWFVASLFLPQHNSTPERPHPLICAFLQAAAAFHAERRNG